MLQFSLFFFVSSLLCYLSSRPLYGTFSIFSSARLIVCSNMCEFIYFIGKFLTMQYSFCVLLTMQCSFFVRLLQKKKIWEVYNQRNPLFLIEDCIPDWRVHLKRYGCQSVTVRGEDLQFCIYWMEISYFYYLFGYICLGGVWKSLFGLMERVYDTVNSFNLISK